MKRFIVSALATISIAGIALASSSSPLSPAYRAIYCYPGGTYWASQVSHYPAYYSAHDAYYQAHYGATTRFCP